MKSLDALSVFPLILALLAGVSAVASETHAAPHPPVSLWSTTNIASHFAVGFVMILSISAIIMLVRETRRELREKRQLKED